VAESSSTEITGIVLAGGKGRRMDGLDKGMVLFREIPLIEHVLNRLAPQVDQLIINANRNFDFYTQAGVPVVPDERVDFAGPLAGMEAALSRVSTPLSLVVPCDTPFLPEDLAARMHRAMNQDGADIVIPDDGDQVQPVFCLMKTSLLDSISRALDGGIQKVQDWLAMQNLGWADFSDRPDAFTNINDYQTLTRLEADD
jgi:molybdopterin-guanine dinucleotide biosynthesis protein A